MEKKKLKLKIFHWRLEMEKNRILSEKLTFFQRVN